MKRSLIIALALMIYACGPDRSQLIVLVNSDFAVPSELSEFRTRVLSEDDRVLAEQSFQLATATSLAVEGQFVLPVSFGVAPREGDPRLSVKIEIDAISSSQDVLFTRRAITK